MLGLEKEKKQRLKLKATIKRLRKLKASKAQTRQSILKLKNQLVQTNQLVAKKANIYVKRCQNVKIERICLKKKPKKKDFLV